MAFGCAPAAPAFVAPASANVAQHVDAGHADNAETTAQHAWARLRAAGADHAAILIVDASSGRILGQAGEVDRPTRVGSTLKPFTIAAALDAGLDLRRRFSGEGGRWAVGDQQFTDSHASESLDATDILVHSSNIGAAKIVDAVGAGVVRRSFDALGLPTDARWDSDEALALADGIGALVSPRALAEAYVSLANDGERVALTRDGSGERRRVFSAATARSVREMLGRAVGDEGTGRRARVAGVHFGSKTGTCMDGERHVTSFAGFLAEPVRQVVVVTATVGEGWGGSVAAPEFARIAAELVLR